MFTGLEIEFISMLIQPKRLALIEPPRESTHVTDALGKNFRFFEMVAALDESTVGQEKIPLGTYTAIKVTFVVVGANTRECVPLNGSPVMTMVKVEVTYGRQHGVDVGT